MNYIKEINAFYVKIETNPLTASATALWYTLMHINNRTRWKNEFSVAASVLCLKSGLPNSTFKRARNELRDKGFITYTSRGRQAPMYKVISLLVEEREDDLSSPANVEDPFDLVKIDDETEVDHEEAAIIDQVISADGGSLPVTEYYFKNDVRKIGEYGNRLSLYTYCYYVDHFGEPTEYIKEELYEWARKINDLLVYEALFRAVKSGRLSWPYARGILRKWYNDGLHTVEDVLKAEVEFRRERVV